VSDRREFLAATGGALGGALGAALLGARVADASPAPAAAKPGSLTVLFQGDSITDNGRNRTAPDPNSAAQLGSGYPYLIAALALAAEPARGLRFFNRGISGNKVPDLVARWDADTIALKPDVLSVLVGVNDFWHKLLNGYTGTTADYEKGYGDLLRATRAALPATRLVVLEPFVLRTGSVDARWFPEFDERRAAAARVAHAAGATFIPLQTMFDRLTRNTPPAFWAADGVHPTPAGHAAIARAWRDAVRL
jgi:lysophospholipase L1-like esterase